MIVKFRVYKPKPELGDDDSTLDIGKGLDTYFKQNPHDTPHMGDDVYIFGRTFRVMKRLYSPDKDHLDIVVEGIVD